MEDANHVWPSANCTSWPQYQQGVSCDARAKRLSRAGITFYANERVLHYDSAVPGEARTCPQFESLIVLRNPVDRVQSHIQELYRVYKRLGSLHPGDWNSPDLFTWTTWAPAPLDNYMTRTLLGRHFMCKDFGDLEERHLSSAALTLSTMDHILLLGEDALNDVAMRVGLGWAKTLRSKHFRWSVDQNFEDRYRYRGKDPMSWIQETNYMDGLLHVLGGLLLRLDAAFHTSVALVTSRVDVSCSQHGSREQSTPQVIRSGSSDGTASSVLNHMDSSTLSLRSSSKTSERVAAAGALGTVLTDGPAPVLRNSSHSSTASLNATSSRALLVSSTIKSAASTTSAIVRESMQKHMLRGEEEVHKSLDEEALHETGYQLGNGRASFHAEAAHQDVKATLSWGYANIDDLRARKLYMDPDFLPFRLLETILMLQNFQSMKRASNRTLRDHMHYHEYGPHLSGWDSSQHDRLLNALHQCNVNATGISYNGTELMAENETGIRADISARRPKGSEDELYLRDWEFQLAFRLPLYLGLMQRY